MISQIEDAEFVLVVCTENYERRFRGREAPGKGLGVRWEGAIITQEIYEAEAKNTVFIPVLLSPHPAADIPIILRSSRYYELYTPEGYHLLYRRVTHQPLIVKPELGLRRPMPPGSAPDVLLILDKQMISRSFKRSRNMSVTPPCHRVNARYRCP
jgi:hypothetical protein